VFARAIDAASHFLGTQDLEKGLSVAVINHDLADSWVLVLALQSLGMHTVCAKSIDILEALALDRVHTLVTTESEFAKRRSELGGSTVGRVIAIPNPTYSDDKLPSDVQARESREPGGHILYTSGTTGSNKKLFWAGDLQPRRTAERILTNPYCGVDTAYHCLNFGLWTALGYRNALATWQLGGCVIIEQREEWPRYFLDSGLTHASLLPDQVHQLLEFADEQLSAVSAGDFQLIVTGGFLPQKTAEQLIARITGNLLNAYASTETYCLTLGSKVTNREDLYWLTPTGSREVEIADEDGNECPVGVEGRLRIRLLAEDCCSYLDDPQASAIVFSDGCFYPGDRAVQRADGRVRIVGRGADVINFRGQKMSVAPLESDIQDRLGVKAVCLFSGIGTAGEELVMIAVQAQAWPEKALLNNVGREFSRFGQVDFALFQQFPRTQTGTSKIDRIALRKLIFPAETPPRMEYIPGSDADSGDPGV
jgi:acyl-coenzyme A synthetase/AMP-(fatty) acid ligase